MSPPVAFMMRVRAFSGERVATARKVRVRSDGAVEVFDPLRGRGWTQDHSLTEREKVQARAKAVER